MSALEKKFDDLEPTEEAAAQCVAFVGDNQTHGVVESVARQFFDGPVVRDGGTQQALEYLSIAPTPKVLIVDIGESSAPLTALLSLTAAFTVDTRLIGIGTINDINMYREMIGAGITDYLTKPVTEKALAAALCRTEEPVPQAAAPSEGAQTAASKANRIAIIGSRGGVGASSLAVNLAWLFSDELKQHTTLVDLDLEFGTVALSLDLEPTRGLREALESPGRIDTLFIDSATAKLTERLSVMATEETLAQRIAYNPEAVDVLFEALGRSNDCIIVDLPRAAFDVRQRVFEAASKIVLVTELTLSGLRDAMRILTGVEEAAPGTPVIVIGNQAGGAHQAMQPKDFQKALGHKVDFLIPEDKKAFNQAANKGKPVVQVSNNGPATKAMRRIAKTLSTGKGPAEEKSKASWRKLFKKEKKIGSGSRKE